MNARRWTSCYQVFRQLIAQTSNNTRYAWKADVWYASFAREGLKYQFHNPFDVLGILFYNYWPLSDQSSEYLHVTSRYSVSTGAFDMLHMICSTSLWHKWQAFIEIWFNDQWNLVGASNIKADVNFYLPFKMILFDESFCCFEIEII